MSIYALSSYIIVLLIGAVFITTVTNAFAADDPFKNKVETDADVDNKIPVMKLAKDLIRQFVLSLTI